MECLGFKNRCGCKREKPGGHDMKRIAIVEDERLMREELSEMLGKAGYQVWEMREFADVEAQLLRLSPDLVLLDLNLPGESGFATFL